MKHTTMMFTAAGCAPCTTVKRMLKREGNETLAKRVRFVDLDGPDEDAQLFAQHKVRAMPTFIRDDGQRHVGAMTKRELLAWLGG